VKGHEDPAHCLRHCLHRIPRNLAATSCPRRRSLGPRPDPHLLADFRRDLRVLVRFDLLAKTYS
jgi:hypothetical protein